jgi:hypothetical protein
VGRISGQEDVAFIEVLAPSSFNGERCTLLNEGVIGIATKFRD